MVLCVLVVSLVSLVLGVIFHPFNINPKDNYIELNISKLNQTNFQKFSGFVQSAFDASLEVEMHVNENGSLRATKTIFLKNVGKSERGVLSIHYLYPAIKIDKVVLRNLKLDNASIIQGKDVVFLAFRLSKGKIGEVEVCYQVLNINLKEFGWYSLIFRKNADHDKQIEISPAYFLDEKFNGSVSNYTISLILPLNWNGSILDTNKKGYWSLDEVKEEKDYRILKFTSHSSKYPLAVVGLFDLVARDVRLGEKNIKISLLLPKELKGKEEIAKTTEDILKTYSEWYGDYPFSFLQVVVSRNVKGGMNGKFGVILISNRSVDWHLSHEIAHFWFGGKAHFGVKDESLATFSELTYLNKLSKEKGENFAEDLDSVEKFCLKYNLSLNEAYSKSLSPNEMYAIVYLKGGMVFRSLQFVSGNETFFRGMKLIVNKCSKICSLADIENVFEKISNKNLDWFFKEWFYSAKVPDYEITNLSYENHILGFEIADKNNLRMPVEIKVVAAREVSTERVWVNGTNKTRIALNIERKPDKIVIDPSEWMVNWNKKYSVGRVEIVIN